MMKDWIPDRAVLLTVSIGLIAILLAIVIGILFHVPQAGKAEAIPGWAENVLVAIATGTLLKVGDAINALVALASGKQLSAATSQLAHSTPVNTTTSRDAAEAAQETADAAKRKADAIEDASENFEDEGKAT